VIDSRLSRQALSRTVQLLTQLSVVLVDQQCPPIQRALFILGRLCRLAATIRSDACPLMYRSERLDRFRPTVLVSSNAEVLLQTNPILLNEGRIRNRRLFTTRHEPRNQMINVSIYSSVLFVFFASPSGVTLEIFRRSLAGRDYTRSTGGGICCRTGCSL